MPKNLKRPNEGDELWLPGKGESHSFIKVFAGQSLTPDQWLVYDSLGMPREVKHDGTKWVIITNENK